MNQAEWQRLEDKEHRQHRLVNTCGWIVCAGCLVVAAPIIIDYWRELVMGLACFVFFAFIFVEACRAAFDGYAPSPQKGWVGAEMPVGYVSHMDLVDGEDAEQWKGTSKYVTPAGTEPRSVYIEGLEEDKTTGVEFGVVSEDKRKQKLAEIAEQEKRRREEGVELEVKK